MAYASQTDLTNVGLPPNALATLSTQQINAALQSASDFADTFFRARFGDEGLPLAAWDTTVTETVAKIAAYRLMVVRGYAPNSTADQRFRDGYDDAVDWLNKVQRQQAHPKVTLANSAVAPQQPNFQTSSVVAVATGRRSTNRGW